MEEGVEGGAAGGEGDAELGRLADDGLHGVAEVGEEEERDGVAAEGLEGDALRMGSFEGQVKGGQWQT